MFVFVNEISSEINIYVAIVKFPFQVSVFMDGASTSVYNLQVRHSSFARELVDKNKHTVYCIVCFIIRKCTT